jgi:hypothetical protein
MQNLVHMIHINHQLEILALHRGPPCQFGHCLFLTMSPLTTQG